MGVLGRLGCEGWCVVQVWKRCEWRATGEKGSEVGLDWDWGGLHFSGSSFALR